ncbi:Oligopeptide transport system permease protein AppC [Geodia barretti]|uniref:Oligopeptide transport system permease protein AppC n=1 Tax=Geodia barretti TaxID=519541 RepID=A0AA35T8Q8_GEOBA|nr:Oligopeptide transport system permease protein AppC [Geodia barretti]
MLCEFFAPYTLDDNAKGFENHPPMRIRFVDLDGRFHLHPFVYGATRTLDMTTFKTHWTPNPDERFPIHLLRFFGVKEGRIFLLGTDKWGRDMLSRILYGGRVSLTIGWAGVMISLVLGILIGALSGYFAGAVDLVVQRVIEVLMSVYFGLVVILSFIGWTGLARVVRGMILSHRETQYILAARNIGAGTGRIMARNLGAQHLQLPAGEPHPRHPRHDPGRDQPELPGLGIRPPMTSWGVLLSEAQNLNNVVNNTWYLIPALFVVAAILAFNFVGDGLRDAADPFSSN